mgnify:CR=1 FL=1
MRLEKIVLQMKMRDGRPKSKRSVDAVNGVKSIERAVLILRHIAGAGAPVGVRECARDLALPRSAVHRVIRTLAALQVLEGSPDGQYTIGPLAHEIGNGFAHGKDVVRAGLHHMETTLKNVTSHLGRLDGQGILILAAREGQGPVRVSVHPGDHYYVHCTALGKALIAFASPLELREVVRSQGLPPKTPHTITTLARLQRELELVRKRGFSVSMEESTLGVASIGAPITAGGQPVAAISISVPVQDVRAKASFLRAATRVITAAQAISRSLKKQHGVSTRETPHARRRLPLP